MLIPVNFLQQCVGNLASTQIARQGRLIMFMDEVVVAGIVIVVLTAGFLGGFAYFVWKDAQKGKKPH